MSSPLKNPFDAYLDKLTGQLRFAPRDLRTEYRDEVRQHLEALAADLIETSGDGLQMTQDQAAAKAMSVFGDPKTVGREIASQIGWGTGVMPGSLGMAVLSGIIWLTILKIVINYLIGNLDIPLVNVWQHCHDLPTQKVIFFLIMAFQFVPVILVPWLAGHLTGLLAPKSAAKGMLIAAAVTLGLYMNQSFGMQVPYKFSVEVYIAWAFRSILWVTLGYFSAFFASMRIRGLKFNMKGTLK